MYTGVSKTTVGHRSQRVRSLNSGYLEAGALIVSFARPGIEQGQPSCSHDQRARRSAPDELNTGTTEVLDLNDVPLHELNTGTTEVLDLNDVPLHHRGN